jgi:rare lipoprotein A
MRSTSFQTARRRVPNRIHRLVAGVAMLGLALSASAKDESSPHTAPVSSAVAEATSGIKITPRAGVAAGAKTDSKANAKTRPWHQIGVASWYGQQFQGRRTAGGERFDMNMMTCAHPTLPMGTWLRVTNLKTLKTAFVRVNDRGPVVDGRIVDLSFAAARMLGLAGVGRVRLDALRDGDPTLAQALMAQVGLPELMARLQLPAPSVVLVR